MLNPFARPKIKASNLTHQEKPIKPILEIYEALVGGTIKKTGNTILVNCPIHLEEHPSCALYESTNSFYCFSCGIGGDYITFVEKIMQVDFKQALEIIRGL